MKIFLTTLIIIILNYTYTISQWIQTNGPEGGEISCITSNGNDLYAGTSLGGIYFSSNNGENWQSISTPLTSTKNIKEFVFHGNDIFVATEVGILFSSDKGKNWELKNNGLTSTYLYDIIKVNDDLFCASAGGTFKSSDWGNSWIPKNSGIEIIFVASLCIVSKDNYLYRGARSDGMMGGGVYKSTNMGEDWLLVGLYGNSVFQLKISEDTIFAATKKGLFNSTDNGATWLFKSIGTGNAINSFLKSDNFYFAGSSSGLFISSNYGKDWTKSDFSNTSILSLTKKDGKIYAASGDGVFSSSDNGLTWGKHNASIISTYLFDIISFNDSIYASVEQDGISVTYNNGNEWEDIEIDSLEKSFKKLSYHNDTIFALAYGKGKILKSIDKGHTWSALSPIKSYFIYDLIVSGTNYIVTTSTGTFLSEDSGQSWNLIESPLISAIKKVDNKLFGATLKGLWTSNDDGLNWEYASTDIKDTTKYLTFLEIKDSTFYSQHYKKGFILSKDLGKTWYRPQNINLHDSTTITSCLIYGSNLLLSTQQSGIYLSTDEGENWKQINDGLTNTYINKLLIKDDYIYAGTAGAGVYKAKLSDFGIINSVENKIEDRNYLFAYPPFPLPAINEVRSLIYWDTSIEIDVEQIAVYNIYGAKVSGHDKIRLDKVNAYSGNLVWDCSGVESGIYVIHLKHGTENRIIKMIVTK